MHSTIANAASAGELHYPWERHPGPDQVVEIAPGILWLRLKLPFRLDHVNIYLIADDDGFALVDTGFGNDATTRAWEALFAGALADVAISRVIVTHAHPDHVGMAGWIVQRFGCPFYMSQIEYLQGVYHQNRRTEERLVNSRQFFRRHGKNKIRMAIGKYALHGPFARTFAEPAPLGKTLQRRINLKCIASLRI